MVLSIFPILYLYILADARQLSPGQQNSAIGQHLAKRIATICEKATLTNYVKSVTFLKTVSLQVESHPIKVISFLKTHAKSTREFWLDC